MRDKGKGKGKGKEQDKKKGKEQYKGKKDEESDEKNDRHISTVSPFLDKAMFSFSALVPSVHANFSIMIIDKFERVIR